MFPPSLPYGNDLVGLAAYQAAVSVFGLILLQFSLQASWSLCRLSEYGFKGTFPGARSFTAEQSLSRAFPLHNAFFFLMRFPFDAVCTFCLLWETYS